ncbi:MAG TPA: endonuclease domain-containing protein [Alphaproteobacteria bacterium]|nr:endonuclease domain-containing protein [Alphaproteobacteria bacterium]
MNSSRFGSPSPTREGLGEGASPPGDLKTRERVRDLRVNATPAERTLWRYLRIKQVHQVRFRRQFPIGPFIADFVCLKAKLIVEVDGGQHDANVAYDENRTKWLESQGFEVIRFWNNDVLESTEGVVNEIASRVEARLAIVERDGGTPSPNPSREGRGI